MAYSTSIILYTKNILEDSSTVTVTGDADAGFPEERLYDRSIDFYWKDTVESTKTFLAEPGTSTPAEVDFLAIERHNFNGETMAFQYSTGQVAWTTADGVADWVQGDNNQITKTMSASTTAPFWRVTVTDTANPKCSEVFMSLGYEFDYLADPAPIKTHVDNVQWNRTVGGLERATKFGDERRSVEYSIFVSSSGLTDFETAVDYLDDYSKPFYIKDHESNHWFCRFTEPPVKTYDHPDHIHINLRLLEVL